MYAILNVNSLPFDASLPVWFFRLQHAVKKNKNYYHYFKTSNFPEGGFSVLTGQENTLVCVCKHLADISEGS
jgi:hypothetical protein